jgi:putative hydrolase of the HAD superfamily
LNAPIELITIDLDDTLWPGLATIQRAEDALHAWLGERAPRVTDAHDQASLRAHRRHYVEVNPSIAHDLTAVRRDALADLLPGFGYDAALAEDALDVFLAHRNRVEPFPDVAPALRALAGSFRLVSVTNGNSDVSRTPLRGLFHLSLTAADVGAAKPDPALFRAALDWAGLEPAQALHLGDHPYLDIEPARELGMRAIWVNRNEQRWPAELEPPLAEVADMQALQRWLDEGADGA